MHGFEGINSVTLARTQHALDDRIFAAAKELADEFPFNRDMNSGYQLGIGEPKHPVMKIPRIGM